MKTTFVKTAVLATGLFMVTATNAQSTTTKTTSTKTTVTTEVKSPTAEQTARADKQTAKINNLVKLTPAQETKVKAITLESLVKEDQQKIDAKGDQKKLAELDKARVANREAKLKEILTPSQYTTMVKAFEDSRNKQAPAAK